MASAACLNSHQSNSFLPSLRDRTTLVMVCGSGERAALATKLAMDMGWHAVVLKGGMKAWYTANELTVFQPSDRRHFTPD